MIEFRNVCKRYETGTEAVKNANFVIEKGEFAFLVGASGSGKSTLIKLILKFKRPCHSPRTPRHRIIFYHIILFISQIDDFCLKL